MLNIIVKLNNIHPNKYNVCHHRKSLIVDKSLLNNI